MINYHSLVIFLCTAMVLTGCWDNVDLERRNSVIAIAIDRAKENKNLYEVSIQVPIPQRIMGGAGGKKGQEAVRILSTTGHTLNEASENLQKRLNQAIFYGHTRIVAFSEEVAREGIKELIDPFRRSPQVRRLMWPMVVQGRAGDLLLTNPELEQIPTVYIMDLLQNGAKTGLIPDMTLGKFFIDSSDQSTEPAMNYVQANRNNVKWNGLAVFEGDRMVGTLHDDETWSLLQLRDEQIAGELEVPFSKKKERNLVTFRPKTVKVERNFTPQGTTSYTAEYNVRVEGDVIESQCDIDFTNSKNIKQLQQELSKAMNARANKLISNLQGEFKVDVLKLGLYARAMHPNWWNQVKWSEIFPRGNIQVNYDVFIRRTGMEMK